MPATDRTVVRALRDALPEWVGALTCPRCGSAEFYRQLMVVCRRCGLRCRPHQTNVPRSRLSVGVWYLAAYLIHNGASVRQLTILGISYKTSSRIARFVRQRLGIDTTRHRRISSARVLELILGVGRGMEDVTFRRNVCHVFWDFDG